MFDHLYEVMYLACLSVIFITIFWLKCWEFYISKFHGNAKNSIFLSAMESLYPWCGQHKPWFVFHILSLLFEHLCRISYFFHHWKLQGAIERDIIMGKITRHPPRQTCWPYWPYTFTAAAILHKNQSMRYIDTIQHGPNYIPNNQTLCMCHMHFYRTQIYLGSDQWVRMSVQDLFVT